jgi:hypothetical protein
MEFQLVVHYNGASEPDMAAFLVFVRDNYGAEVRGAAADGETFRCHATLVFATLDATIAAVQAFKGAFAITYRLAIT